MVVSQSRSLAEQIARQGQAPPDHLAQLLRFDLTAAGATAATMSSSRCSRRWTLSRSTRSPTPRPQRGPAHVSAYRFVAPTPPMSRSSAERIPREPPATQVR